MDKLKIGNVQLEGSVHFTTAKVGDKTFPALELRVKGPVDEAALEAMSRGSLEIYGEDGLLQGSHQGYSTVARHSVVLAKVTDEQQELMAAKAALAQVQAEHAALLYETLTGEVL